MRRRWILQLWGVTLTAAVARPRTRSCRGGSGWAAAPPPAHPARRRRPVPARWHRAARRGRPLPLPRVDKELTRPMPVPRHPPLQSLQLLPTLRALAVQLSSAVTTMRAVDWLPLQRHCYRRCCGRHCRCGAVTTVALARAGPRLTQRAVQRQSTAVQTRHWWCRQRRRDVPMPRWLMAA